MSHITMQQAIEIAINDNDLNSTQMTEVMELIMTGGATDAQIAGFLIALRAKGETVTEITAAASVMRKLSSTIEVNAKNMVDMVGTGGDATSTFNISTAATFVISAAGAIVAKHGNRSVSSKSGSADVLESLGVKLDIDSHKVASCIDSIGLSFMFAPMHHSAMKHAITARKEMGTRTIFNLLGPLTNPANVKRQVTGVYDKDLVLPIAQVLQNLGTTHAMVVCGADGLDEISLSGDTYVAELKDNQIKEYIINPADFGIDEAPLSKIVVADVNASKDMLLSVLDAKTGAALDIVAINSGAAIYVAGLADSLPKAIEIAYTTIESKKAMQKLEQLITETNS